MLTASFAVQAEDGSVETGEVRSRIIDTFRVGSAETRFGTLEFVGGLEMTSPLSNFGALSSIRFLDGGERFLGVADTGFWFAGRIERDAQGKPTGVTDFRIKPMPDTRGIYSNEKWETDAESLVIAPDGVIVAGFERLHRVSRFRPGADGFAEFETNLDFVVPARELRNNRGFETLTFRPDGALVGITEKSIDKAGNIFAAIMTGPDKGVFKVARSDEYDVTDGDFLPDGDLLILERRFSMADSVGMRIRRIEGAEIKPGATVDGAVLLEADFSYQIDNMEGLDAWQAPDGSIHVSLVSDDNHSLLQRNLYLEFRLAE